MKTKQLLLSLISCLFVALLSCSNDKPGKAMNVQPILYKGSYNNDFNDLNEKHLAAAVAIGVEPVQNRDEAEKMKRTLKEIETNKLYVVEPLTHSIPFVVPPAYDLLDRIGKDFSAFLKEKNAPQYKVIITSVTRTLDDCKRLGQTNINASQNSAHCYGTTIDISWRRFEKNDRLVTDLTEGQLKAALANVLRNLQQEGLCYIKHERKQACFHITAR